MKLRCEFCHKEYSIGPLQTHLRKIHNSDLIEYYLKYINPNINTICEFCGKQKRFNGFKNGFSNTCKNPSCRNKYVNKYFKNKQKNGCIKRNQKWKNERISGKSKQDLIIEKGLMKRKNKQSQTSKKISKTLSLKDSNGHNCVQRGMFKKHGVYNPMHLDSVKEKLKTIFQKNYGVDWITSSPTIQHKIQQSCLEKYGVNNYTKSTRYKKQMVEFYKENQIDKIIKYFQINKLELISDLSKIYIDEKTKIEYRCSICNTIYNKCWNDIQSWWVCRKCFPHDSSQEQEIKCFLDDNNISYLEKVRLIKNTETNRFLELDFYIPEFNLAIEFDGLYWHSTKHQLNNDYHLNKTELCLNRKIQLIHIFEDEWKYKKDIVMSRLKYKLNLIDKDHRIFARKCKIQEVPYLEKQTFLNDNHLQGNDISKINLGLYYDNKLVSLMTFSSGNIAKGSKTKKRVYELSRFCNLKDTIVLGGASKLLTHFKRNYKWETIFSYADRRWSDGDIYYKLGFNFLHFTTPNYWYINLAKNLKRHHRYTFRKSELKKLNSYDSKLTEFQIMSNEGYDRIYDCGNYKFTMENEIIENLIP